MKFNEQEMIILKRAYIDYKQLERQLNIDFGDTRDLRAVYDYIDEMRKYNKTIGFTNVDLEEGYFDFNYNDMCLTISVYNKAEYVRLSDGIEIWNNEKLSLLVGLIEFNELEKIVLGYDKGDDKNE